MGLYSLVTGRAELEDVADFLEVGGQKFELTGFMQCLFRSIAVGFCHRHDAAHVVGDILTRPTLLINGSSDRIHLLHGLASTLIDPLQRICCLLRQIGPILCLPGPGSNADNRALRLTLNGGNHGTDFTGGL